MRVVSWLVFLALVISYGGAIAGPAPGKSGQQMGPQKSLRHELGGMVGRATPVELGTEPITVNISLNKEAGAKIEAALAPASKTELILTVGGIEFEKIPEVHYQLYVNLPTSERPDYKSASFVGNLTFFDLQPHNFGADHPAGVVFDIKRAVRELKSRKLWNDKEASVTFVMSWLEDRSGRQLPVPPGMRARFRTLTISSLEPEPPLPVS
jgi:hypothetical protein